MKQMLIAQNLSDKNEVWVSGQSNHPGSQLIHWLGFLAISIMLHVIILKWINIPEDLNSNDSAGITQLSINVIAELEKQGQTESPAEIKGGQSRNNLNTVNVPVNNTKEKKESQGLVHDTEKLPDNNSATKIRAQTLIESAYKEIPGIANKLEEKALPGISNEIFDLAFRKKLEDSRSKKQQQHKIERENRGDEFAEVTGHYEGFIGIRLDGKCWRVPIANSLKAFDTRIWMPDPGCTKRKKLNFATH